MSATVEEWPQRRAFRFAGHLLTTFRAAVAVIQDDNVRGRGEAAGIFYRGDVPAKFIETLEDQKAAVSRGLDREALQSLLPPGGARNALDCALWEWESLRTRTPVWKLVGLEAPPRPLLTTYTVGLDTPVAMGKLAATFAAEGARAIKVKLDGDASDFDRVAAVRAACPELWIGVDPNQAWSFEQLQALASRLLSLKVALIEQPLPVGADDVLQNWRSPIELAVDESLGTSADLPNLRTKYQVANIKLDKSGGLTEAMACARAARRLGFKVMVGNMGGTSLSMAPAFLVGQLCDLVDLDGPLNLVADREPKTIYSDGYISIGAGTWGYD